MIEAMKYEAPAVLETPRGATQMEVTIVHTDYTSCPAPVARKPLAPKLRWTVFARDHYRCRYCGATPPDVVLVVDHVVAVARGGTDEISNLLTACETCNQGKGASAPPLALSPEWARLVERVPALRDLADEMSQERGGEGFCANAVWYGRNGYRRRMMALVGWEAHHADPWVNSMAAYDLAYKTLYALLPDCDHEDRLYCVRIG